jgi:hypothetical protein
MTLNNTTKPNTMRIVKGVGEMGKGILADIYYIRWSFIALLNIHQIATHAISGS